MIAAALGALAMLVSVILPSVDRPFNFQGIVGSGALSQIDGGSGGRENIGCCSCMHYLTTRILVENTGNKDKEFFFNANNIRILDGYLGLRPSICCLRKYYVLSTGEYDRPSVDISKKIINDVLWLRRFAKIIDQIIGFVQELATSSYEGFSKDPHTWASTDIGDIEANGGAYGAHFIVHIRGIDRVNFDPRSLIDFHFVELPLHNGLLRFHGAELQARSDEKQSGKDADDTGPSDQIPIKLIFGWIGIIISAALSAGAGAYFATAVNWRGWLILSLGMLGAAIIIYQSAPLIGLG